MPAAVPSREDSCSFLDEANHVTSAMSKLSTSDAVESSNTKGTFHTPIKKGMGGIPVGDLSHIVSPASSVDSFASSSSSAAASAASADDDDSDGFDAATKDAVKSIVITEHKRAELEGHHAEEPLLKENPNRFVLFPIQDTEVR